MCGKNQTISRIIQTWMILDDGNKLHQTSSDPPIQDDLSRFSWCNKPGFPVQHLQITVILHVRKVSNCTDCIPMFTGKNQGFGCFESTCSYLFPTKSPLTTPRRAPFPAVRPRAKDIVVAAMMGAEEFGFGSVAMIAEGCQLMRIERWGV